MNSKGRTNWRKSVSILDVSRFFDEMKKWQGVKRAPEIGSG
jgi:hypothetical protein